MQKLQDLEGLKKEITDAAAAEVNTTIEKAEAAAREHLEAARQQGEKLQREILAAAKETAVEKRRRILSNAALAERKQILAAKQELLDQAFAATQQELGQLPLAEYQQVIRQLLGACATEDCTEVLIAPSEQERITQELVDTVVPKSKLMLVVTDAVEAGGFVLRGKNLEINCTLSTLVAQARERLTSEVAKVLFKEGSQQ